MIKKIPIPICGLALRFAALGNLLVTFGPVFRYKYTLFLLVPASS